MSEEEIFRKFLLQLHLQGPADLVPGAVGPGGGRGPAAVSVLHADPAAGGCPGRRGGGDGGPGQRDEAAAETPGVQ